MSRSDVKSWTATISGLPTHSGIPSVEGPIRKEGRPSNDARQRDVPAPTALSSRFRTTGNRSGRLAQLASIRSSSGISGTILYRKRRAASA
jgi:hypothetical protein